MDDLINTVSRAARLLLGELATSHVMMAVVSFSLVVPLVHLVRGSRASSLTRSEIVLPLYFVVALLGLGTLAIIGVTLRSHSPGTFEEWRVGLNEGADDNPAAMILKIVMATPMALLVSGLLYGLSGGWKKWLLSVIATPIAAAMLYGIVVIGAISIGCSAWSTCI